MGGPAERLRQGICFCSGCNKNPLLKFPKHLCAISKVMKIFKKSLRIPLVHYDQRSRPHLSKVALEGFWGAIPPPGLLDLTSKV